MTRIFLVMAAINAVLLIGATALGFISWYDLRTGGEVPAPNQPLDYTWQTAHFVIGLGSALFCLLLHCLIFTYFLGTGRWVKEVARAYDLPDDPLPRKTREFKRSVFPPALFAMLSIIATVAAGAGAQTKTWPWWIHLATVLIALSVNGWAYLVEYQIVSANARVLDEVMEEVTVRQEAQASDHTQPNPSTMNSGE